MKDKQNLPTLALDRPNMNLKGRIATVITTIFLSGCMIGSVEKYVPSSIQDEENGYEFTCNGLKVTPVSSTSGGILIMHYIIPLGIFPQGPEGTDDLVFTIYTENKDSTLQKFENNDLQIYLNDISSPLVPYRHETESINCYRQNKPFTYFSTDYFVNINREDVDAFKLVFKDRPLGCEFPPVFYKKIKEKYMFSINQ